MNADEESTDEVAPRGTWFPNALMGAFVVFPAIGFWSALGLGWGMVWAGVASGAYGYLLGSE